MPSLSSSKVLFSKSINQDKISSDSNAALNFVAEISFQMLTVLGGLFCLDLVIDFCYRN